jgi:cytoskeletal protein CcmA (bactofilin family)
MWKRDQGNKPITGQPAAPAAPPPQVATLPIAEAATPVAAIEPVRQSGKSEANMVNIGKSVVIKGDLQGSEDLMIEGQVEGKIELKDNVLTIGPNGRIKAQVFAKTVVVLGTINGNVTATEKIDIRDSATVEGNVLSPKVAIAEGAQFHGSVDMQRSAKKPQQPSNTTQVPGAKPAATPAASASMH